MELLQIAICEDDHEDKEKLIKNLENILDAYKIAHCITCFHSGEALLDCDTKFHLIFMDIAMNGKNGIETGRQIYNRSRTSKIIYQTNFRNFCEEAVNTVHAFAFLTKPITEEMLREQIKEFLKQTPPEEPLLEFDKISYLENRLKPLGFATSCRGILVNMENISRIKNYKIFFKNGECVALSQKRAVEFKKNLNAYIHKGE